MGEIVNLRQVRKQKAHKDAEQAAQTNRAKFGRTKAERERDRLEAGRLASKVDGAKREGDV